MQIQQPTWKALLIGGPSGVGKTGIAQQLGQRFGVPWLQVDDLRLSLIRSRAVLPENNAALYFFQRNAAWKGTPQQFRDALIAMGNAMSPSIEVVVENHVDTDAPLILEGDAILPSLITRPSIQSREKYVRIVFLVEPDEGVLLSNTLARGRGMDAFTSEEQRVEARAKWLYGQWLIEEAGHYNLPVITPRPWETLEERIIAVTT